VVAAAVIDDDDFQPVARIVEHVKGGQTVAQLIGPILHRDDHTDGGKLLCAWVERWPAALDKAAFGERLQHTAFGGRLRGEPILLQAPGQCQQALVQAQHAQRPGGEQHPTLGGGLDTDAGCQTVDQVVLPSINPSALKMSSSISAVFSADTVCTFLRAV